MLVLPSAPDDRRDASSDSPWLARSAKPGPLSEYDAVRPGVDTASPIPLAAGRENKRSTSGDSGEVLSGNPTGPSGVDPDAGSPSG